MAQKDISASKEVFNETFVSSKLLEVEKLLKYLKDISPSLIPLEIKVKLSNINEVYGDLLMRWVPTKRSGEQNRTTNRIDQTLWDDNILLKYLFEDYIDYSEKVSPEFLPQLCCNVCKMDFICSSKNLLLHLKEKSHLDNFDKIKLKFLFDDSKLWDHEIMKLLFERHIILNQIENKLFCKICCIDFHDGKIDLIDHLESSRHLRNFENIINFDRVDLAHKNSIQEILKNCLFKKKVSVDSVKSNDLLQNISLPVQIVLKHDEFMSAVCNLFSQNKHNPIFCQPCCYFNCTLDSNKGTGTVNHEIGKNHGALMSKVDHATRMKFDWRYCSICRSYLFCDLVFLSFHSKHHLHKAIRPETRSLVGDQSNNSNNSTSSVKTNLSNEKSISQEDKNIRRDDGYQNKNGLVQNMKIVLENLLKNPDKILNDSKHYCGFYCKMCNYWTNNEEYWQKHLFNDELHKYHSVILKDNVLKICDCKVIIICDDRFYEQHKLSLEHQNLKRFLSNKCLTSNHNEEKLSDLTGNAYSMKILPDDKILKDLNVTECSNQMIRDDDSSSDVSDYDYDSNSDVSSVCSVSSQSSVHDSRRFLSGLRGRNRNQFGGRSNVRNKNGKSCVAYGIKGLRGSTTEKDISNVFQLFGTVKHVNFVNSNSANVYLVLRDGTKNHIGTSVMIKDKEITIEKRIPLNFELPRFISTYFSSVGEFFGLAEDLYRRAEFFMTRDETIRRRHPSDLTEIERDVKNSTSRIKNVITIGSRATGLTFGHSFIDLFVEIDGSYFGNKTQDVITLSSRAVLIETALRNSGKFDRIKIIGDVSPIVHALHLRFNIECRIFLHNGLVVENTKLIRTYLQFDERIRQLILIIKEWAKHTKLAEVISQYAVTWMVLYYLMRGKSPVIHPVIVLRNNSQVGRTFIAGWDCRFCYDVSQLPKLRNRQSIYELLSGFFLFFGSNNIIKYVHCPLTGQPFLKGKFHNLSLPAPFSKYIGKINQNLDERFPITNGICLQDPLELNVNLTQNLIGVELQRFKWMCSKSANKLRCLYFKQ